MLWVAERDAFRLLYRGAQTYDLTDLSESAALAALLEDCDGASAARSARI
jgi:hypothetical protein